MKITIHDILVLGFLIGTVVFTFFMAANGY